MKRSDIGWSKMLVLRKVDTCFICQLNRETRNCAPPKYYSAGSRQWQIIHASSTWKKSHYAWAPLWQTWVYKWWKCITTSVSQNDWTIGALDYILVNLRIMPVQTRAMTFSLVKHCLSSKVHWRNVVNIYFFFLIFISLSLPFQIWNRLSCTQKVDHSSECSPNGTTKSRHSYDFLLTFKQVSVLTLNHSFKLGRNPPLLIHFSFASSLEFRLLTLAVTVKYNS